MLLPVMQEQDTFCAPEGAPIKSPNISPYHGRRWYYPGTTATQLTSMPGFKKGQGGARRADRSVLVHEAAGMLAQLNMKQGRGCQGSQRGGTAKKAFSMRKVAVLCISSLLWLCPSRTVYAAAAMVRVQQICAPQ